MLIYFDCEFTDLIEDFGQIKLISAGFVAENGEELYFELKNSYEKSDCSDFVIKNVLPHLDNSKYGMTSAQAAVKLKSWLASFNEKVYLASDAPQYDWLLIRNLLLSHKSFPDNLSKEPVSINANLIDDGYQKYFEYQPLAIRHHALWDSRALSFATGHG